jgi:CRISPR-associated protein Cmr3
VLARWDGHVWTACFPVPRDLVHPPDEPAWVDRLAPQTPQQVVTDLPDAPAMLLAGHGEPVRGWLHGATLSAYLHGDLVSTDGVDVTVLDRVYAPDDPLVPASPLVREARMGLTRTSGRTAARSMLYQATYLRPRDEVALLAQVVLPAGWNRSLVSPVPLGGQARLADVAPVSGVGWPDPPGEFPGGRVLAYVATPALWPGGWRFPVPERATLTAAAVGPVEPVATASPRRGRLATRMLRWAVPAGSVYLLTFDTADGAATWARAVHGTAYLGADAPRDDERLRTAGFGVILTGVWS